MDAATVVVDAVVVEITEDAAMAAVETAATAVDAAEMGAADAIITAVDGITGDGAGTGIQEKLFGMVSGKVMMPVSVTDSRKDETMTADLAARVVLEVWDAQVKAVIPGADAASFYF